MGIPDVQPPAADPSPVGRRSVLRLGLAAGASLLLPRAVSAAVSPAADRMLSFVNVHTGERIEARFWSAGNYDPAALAAIDHLLRDHRTGEVKAVDRDLLGLLVDLRRELGTEEPFHVISGYRSPRTNAMLVARSGGGVARHSLHLEARAIDVRLPGVRLGTLREAALDLRRGGVGFYPDLGFVHVDTGRVRRW